MSTAVDNIIKQVETLSIDDKRELLRAVDVMLELKESGATENEIIERLTAKGIITLATNPSAMSDVDPVSVIGKPVSETIIEERR